MSKHEWYWGIASYKRVNRQPMLEMLVGMGYPKDRIILSTQTEEDYKDYSEKWGDMATIIYRPGSNISDNKNTILDYIVENCKNARLVMCSDKVRGINRMGKDKKLYPIDTRTKMDDLVKKAFFVADSLKGNIWGTYSVGNTFYMSHTIHINQSILGCFMGILNPSSVRFDVNLPLKEDLGLFLNTVEKKGRVIRYNDVCLTATLHTTGGCHEAWNSEGDIINTGCCAYLLSRYPKLVKPHATRKNEVRYVGPTCKINKSIFEI